MGFGGGGLCSPSSSHSLAVGWLLGEKASGNRAIYSSGPVSSAHAVFGQNCSLCHVRGASFSAAVEDKACLACHNAPIHNHNRPLLPPAVPAIWSIRAGSRWRPPPMQPVRSATAICMLKQGELKFDPHVSDFDNKHPQFLPLRHGQYDPGTINLNHHAHLQPTLRGPNGRCRCNAAIVTGRSASTSLGPTPLPPCQPPASRQSWFPQLRRSSQRRGLRKPGRGLTWRASSM